MNLDNKTVNVGSSRAIVLDIIRLASKVPSFPVEKWIDVQELADAREEACTRISWLAIFTKAYALASMDVPELRRTYISFPWPRFYQSPKSVVSIAFNRTLHGHERLFFGRIHEPEIIDVATLQWLIDKHTKGDVEKVFQQQIIGSRLPALVRRIGWWWRFLAPSKRAHRVGTGSISVLAGQGVLNRRHPNMLTSSLSYGPMEADGRMFVTLQCDHRMIDGSAAARALNLLEQHLHGRVMDELRYLGTLPKAA